MTHEPSPPFASPMAVIGDPPGNTRQDYIDVVRSGDTDRIEAFLLGVAADATDWPGLPKLPQVLNSLPMPRAAAIWRLMSDRWGNLRELRTATSSPWGHADEGAPLPPSSPLQALLYKAVTLGHRPALRELARRPHLRWHQHASADEITRMVAAMPTPHALRRPLVVDNGSDVTRSEPAGLPCTAVVFTGLADRVSFDLPVFDAFLAARGVNAIYLRDFSRRLFIDGVGALGPDRESSQSALRMLLDELGSERLVFIGNSAGGFAAIDWGCDLGARHVIGLSAPTNTSPAFVEAIGDRRAAAVFQRITGKYQSERLDLRTRLAGADPAMRITLHFGEATQLDRAHAQALADLPQVTLCPVPGYASHDVLFPIAWSGGIDAMFAPFGTVAAT